MQSTIMLLTALDVKEIKNAFDVFSISPEEKSEYLDTRKKEEPAHDFRSADEFRSKDKHMYGRSARDETDTWAYIAAESDRDVIEDISGKLHVCNWRQRTA